MTDPLVENFDDICARIAHADNMPSAGEDFLEPLYIELLAFLVQNEREHAKLSQRIMERLGEHKRARQLGDELVPIQALAYCMHVLRWPEVLAFALGENAEYFASKRSTTMMPIIEAYEDSWADKDMYPLLSSGSNLLPK